MYIKSVLEVQRMAEIQVPAYMRGVEENELLDI